MPPPLFHDDAPVLEAHGETTAESAQQQLDKAFIAVSNLLDAASVDPDLRHALRGSTGVYHELCAAEAAMLHRSYDAVLSERSAQVPQGPRRYLSLAEWHALKAREIETEGLLGSHWPGKAAP